MFRVNDLYHVLVKCNEFSGVRERLSEIGTDLNNGVNLVLTQSLSKTSIVQYKFLKQIFIYKELYGIIRINFVCILIYK